MDRLREMADIAKEKTLQAAEIAKDAAKDAIDGEPPTPRSRACQRWRVFAVIARGFAMCLLPLFRLPMSLPPSRPRPHYSSSSIIPPSHFPAPPSSPPACAAPPRHGR